MELEDLEEQDLVFLAAIPAYTEAGKRKNKNLSFETGDTEAPDYDFDLAYGMRQPEEESQPKEPIIRLKEEDYDDHVNKKTEVPVPTKPPRENQKRLIIIGLVCLLLVIGIAVGVAVSVTTAGGGGSIERETTGSDDTGSDDTGSDNTGSDDTGSDTTGSDTTGGSTDKTSAPAPSPIAPSPTAPSPIPPSPTAPSPIPPSSIVRTPFEKVADGLYLFGDSIPTDESTPEYKAINFLAQEDSGKELDSFRLGQRYALANMFYALGGPNWNNDLGFLSKEHECDWRALDNNLIKGVICEEGDGRVNYISIPNNNLAGTIPQHIGYLPSIVHLDLSFNNIGGSIPQGLNAASQMQRLSLNSNQLTGSVPSYVFYSWKELTYFSIERNLLTGDINQLCTTEEKNTVLRADCLGDNAEIQCACCNFCCSPDEKCGNKEG